MGSNSVKVARETNEANVRMNTENNQTQMDIARQNNEWQERMNMVNNQFNHDEAELARRAQQAYDSPVAQLQRFEEAGLNPTIAFQAANGGSSSPAVSAQSHGSGVTPSMPALQAGHIEPVPTQSGIMLERLLKVSDILQGLSKSSLDLASSDRIKSLLGSEIEQADVRTRMDTLQFNFEMMFGQHLRTLEAKKRGAEVVQLYSQAFELASKGELNKALEISEQAKKLSYTELGRLYGNNADFARKQVDAFDETQQATIKELYSRAEESRAAAAKSRAEATTEQELREVRKKVLGAVYEKTVSEAEQQKAINRINDVLDKHGLRIKYQFGHYAVEGEKTAIELEKWKRIYQNRDLLDIAVKAYEMELRKENPADWFTVLDRIESALGSGLTAGAILAK